MATSRPFVALALLASLAVAGCEDGPAPPLFARLDRPAVEPSILNFGRMEPRFIEVCGDARPAVEVTAGKPLYFELPSLHATAWLDVAVAALPDGNSPPPGVDGNSPAPRGASLLPAVRLRVERADRAGAVSGGAREVLYDALPSPGRPPAFGWGEARIELRPPRDRAHELHELLLTAELAEPLPAGATPPKLLIAVPRLAERAFADGLPASWIEWRCELPPAELLPSAAELEQLLAAAGAQLLPIPTGASAPPSPLPELAALPWSAHYEAQRFGTGASSLPPYDRAVPLDRWVRFDGAAAAGPVATALPELAAWGETVLAERQRQLGEHRLFEEIARPRHVPLHVALVTRQPTAPALAALRRLAGHVAANELALRTWLDVTFVAADGAELRFRRRPAIAPHDHG
ncbi:MAG: hypothetical protein JNL90_03695 [Planctomycetes bacterium]|nr:hypothetical protein [Planctomycetota bacterium]